MRIPRFLWPAEAPLETAEEFFLAPDQARHGATVLRLERGARVEVLSAAGLAPAVVTTAEGGGRPCLGVRLVGPWHKAGPATGPTLAVALIQAGRFDWVVEKSVELGAAALIPLMTERVKSGDARPGEARFARWRRLAEEARKQCARPSPLEIKPPMTLADLLAAARDFGPGIFLSPLAAPAELLAPGAEAPLLLTGPEGGFSPAEEKAMLAADFQPKSLGPLTLRAETAALAALARLVV